MDDKKFIRVEVVDHANQVLVRQYLSITYGVSPLHELADHVVKNRFPVCASAEALNMLVECRGAQGRALRVGGKMAIDYFGPYSDGMCCLLLTERPLPSSELEYVCAAIGLC